LSSDKTSHYSRSDRTKAEYRRLGSLLFKRALRSGDLLNVINDTQSPRTFFKRIAAARSCILEIILSSINEVRRIQLGRTSVEHDRLLVLSRKLESLLPLLPQLCSAIEAGFVGIRRKRKSKRLALKGLSTNWREQICRRSGAGKYAIPCLILAATGCRPAELVRGVNIWKAFDDEAGKTCLFIDVEGVKVRDGYGQPERRFVFSADDTNDVIKKIVDIAPFGFPKTVKIENANYFTVEIRRIAGVLWPEHHSAITASCFRHQISADLKRFGDAQMVSQALGHRSGKTKKHYGTAGQSKSMIVPIRVETTYAVLHLEPGKTLPKTNSEPDSSEENDKS
jgi:integrase